MSHGLLMLPSDSVERHD